MRTIIKCVLCDEEAVTTAAHIPVCEKHFNEYNEEGKQYLNYRPFYERLLKAEAAQQRHQPDRAPAGADKQ